jgi:hypothetical protein
LKAETATTVSVDVGYAFEAWETSATFFASDMNDTTRLEPAIGSDGNAEGVRLVNVDGVTQIRGGELLLR